MANEINLREAVNAVSDVIQNRPRPLRDFDQIYMRAGDMVLQSEYIARWADGGTLAFVGDGDAISVCVAYMQAKEILGFGPERIKVFDFDERIVSAVKRFADAEQIEHLDAQLYNCLDPLDTDEEFNFFYTNPPWGASNAGDSVGVFMQRGMELVCHEGEGVVVIADRDDELTWTEEVLANSQVFAAGAGFYVCQMMPRLHSYHLDDNPELRSCNLVLRSRPDNRRPRVSEAIVDPDRLAHFYGDGGSPEVRYILERKRVDYGRALDEEYTQELFNREES